MADETSSETRNKVSDETEYFGRACHIELKAPKGITESSNGEWQTIKGLDIKFDISKPIGAVCMDAKISILGLSWDNITTYCTWAADAVAYAKDYRIRLFAGYGKNEQCIFDGNIVRAMPTMPPDIWLEINARSAYIRDYKVFSQDLIQGKDRNVNIQTYLQTLCKCIESDCDTTGIIRKKDIKLNLPVFPKIATHRDVVDAMNMNCERNDILMVEDIDADGKSIFKFSDRYLAKGMTPENPIDISIDEGMISIPQINWNEIVVKRLLTVDKLDVRGNYIRVESRMSMPGLYDNNGNRKDPANDDIYIAIFRVNNVRYVGHLRGSEWFVEYKAWRNWTESDKGKNEEYKSAIQH